MRTPIAVLAFALCFVHLVGCSPSAKYAESNRARDYAQAVATREAEQQHLDRLENQLRRTSQEFEEIREKVSLLARMEFDDEIRRLSEKEGRLWGTDDARNDLRIKMTDDRWKQSAKTLDAFAAAEKKLREKIVIQKEFLTASQAECARLHP